MAWRTRVIFAARAFARKLQLVRRDRAERRGRPIEPDRVDRVRVDRNQPGARLLTGGRISRDGVGRMESRVVAKLVALLQLTREPFGRRLLRDTTELENRCVRLVLHLLCVSAVDEQRRRVLQHDRDSRRAGESREPPEPLGIGGHVFVLVLVRARNDESREPDFANSARNWLTRAAPCEGSPKATKD